MVLACPIPRGMSATIVYGGRNRFLASSAFGHPVALVLLERDTRGYLRLV
jgi:hypothetical protein